MLSPQSLRSRASGESWASEALLSAMAAMTARCRQIFVCTENIRMTSPCTQTTYVCSSDWLEQPQTLRHASVHPKHPVTQMCTPNTPSREYAPQATSHELACTETSSCSRHSWLRLLEIVAQFFAPAPRPEVCYDGWCVVVPTQGLPTSITDVARGQPRPCMRFVLT